MSVIQLKKDARIFVDQDFTLADVSEEIVGRKGYSLFKLKEMDVPVPSYFCVSSSIFAEYISGTLSSSSISTSSKLSELNKKILSGKFADETKHEILAGYSRLSGFTDSWVAVRSSIVPPLNRPDLTFAGQLDTVLNVKGADDLLAAVKKVYASAFTEKVATYLRNQNSSISEIKVAVVVQKMVQAEVSGITFTVDPISQNKDYMTTEAVFGLGDVMASGEITPDQYIMDKNSLEFKEKRIVPQEWMIVRKVKHKPGEGATQKVNISKAWQHQQKLDNRHLEELAKLAVVIEKKSEEPQDIEWVFEGGRIWILQTKNAQPVCIPVQDPDQPVQISKDIIESAQQIADKEKSRQEVRQKLEMEKQAAQPAPASPTTVVKPQSDYFVSKPLERQVIRPEASHQESTNKRQEVHIPPLPGEKLLITGVGASSGTFRGNVVIINSPEDIKKNKKKINKDAVLVVPDFFSELGKFVTKVGAIISDAGGTTSDIAIRCRESGIPCVMGSHISSRMLQQGENVLVDGSVGAVYGKREYHDVPTKKTAKPSADPKKTKKEDKPAEKPEISKKESAEMPKTATHLFMDLSNSYTRGDNWKNFAQNADGVSVIQIEDIFQKNQRHPGAYISEGKTSDLTKLITHELSDICETANGNTVIASYGSMSVGQYKNLVKGKTEEQWEDNSVNDSTVGLQRLLKRPKEIKAVLSAIKKVRNVEGWRNLSLAVNFAGTPDNLVEFKKLVSASKLRRSSTFKIYLVIDTPSEALIIEDFVAADIDGLIINVKNLSKLMMAPNTDDESVLKMVNNVCQNSQGLAKIIQLPRKSPNLLNKAIKLGSYGIAVSPTRLGKIRKLISEQEQKVLFS